MDSAIELLINEIRNDKIHGASELARQSLGIIKTSAEKTLANDVNHFYLEQEELYRKLVSIRPSMASIYNAITRLRNGLMKEQPDDIETLRQLTVSLSEDLIRTSLQATSSIAEHTTKIIYDEDIIFTHSYSSTVIEALKEAATKHNIQVVVTRSGAGRTGEKTVSILSAAGVPVTFIDDSAAGSYIKRCNKVLVGADRICRDGGLVNGVGTCAVSLIARKDRISFYVLCETLKFDSRLKSSEVEIEEKEPSEVVLPGVLPVDVKVANPYFDITPLEFISGIITEDGLIAREEVIEYMKKLAV
jgi:eIF-2B alpha/beta/delta-like uncharacterized protein